ncbi:hypothetical protein F4810DRAFT_631379 [Camillea tinctor]|nr:hypothetical protein F4810DRAFT_631379 [Camillea tinctor]
MVSEPRGTSPLACIRLFGSPISLQPSSLACVASRGRLRLADAAVLGSLPDPALEALARELGEVPALWIPVFRGDLPFELDTTTWGRANGHPTAWITQHLLTFRHKESLHVSVNTGRQQWRSVSRTPLPWMPDTVRSHKAYVQQAGEEPKRRSPK